MVLLIAASEQSATGSPVSAAGSRAPSALLCKKEAALRRMPKDRFSRYEWPYLSGGGQAASSRGDWMSVSPSESDAWASIPGSPASGAATAKRMTSGTQASAFSRTSTSVM